MAHFRAILLCLIALTGQTMPAQENAAPEERVAIFDGSYPTRLIYLENGRPKTDHKKVQTKNWHLEYTYNGRDYRMMSRSEVVSFDAMPKVEVRRHRLYFDGREIKTNAWRVYEIRSAHYWNGGVLLTASTSKGISFPESYRTEIGFLDPNTCMCRFTPVSTYIVRPEFITPVTIDTSREDIVLDVVMPDRVYRHEAFDLTVSVTNNSGGPVRVPLPLADGLGVGLASKKDVTKPPEHITRLYGEDILPRGGTPDPAPVTLAPRENVTATIHTGVSALTTDSPHSRFRLAFQWDALLDPNDRERMTRLACERWLDVIESPLVDTTSRDLALEVSAPAGVSFSENYEYLKRWRSQHTGQHGMVHAEGAFKVKVAITNVSNRIILVPDDLGDGLGVVRLRPAYRDERRIKATSVGGLYEPSLVRRPAVRFPYAASCSPLAPGVTREMMVRFDPNRTFWWMSIDERYPLTFVWDGLLDPDDREHVSRFSTGKTVWVEVTK